MKKLTVVILLGCFLRTTVGCSPTQSADVQGKGSLNSDPDTLAFLGAADVHSQACKEFNQLLGRSVAASCAELRDEQIAAAVFSKVKSRQVQTDRQVQELCNDMVQKVCPKSWVELIKESFSVNLFSSEPQVALADNQEGSVSSSQRSSVNKQSSQMGAQERLVAGLPLVLIGGAALVTLLIVALNKGGETGLSVAQKAQLKEIRRCVSFKKLESGASEKELTEACVKELVPAAEQRELLQSMQ